MNSPQDSNTNNTSDSKTPCSTVPDTHRRPKAHTPLLSPQKILITGGCGFIGRNLIIHLIKGDSGIKIRVLDNLSVGTQEDLSEICSFTNLNPSVHTPKSSNKLELLIGDIKDYDVCLRACEEIDIVVHLAANTGVGPSVDNPRADMEANVIGVFNMLEAARYNKVKKFIFASSGAPIGECTPPIHEELAPHPVSPYGASKLAGEGYCSAYHRTFGLKTISLRFGNVYGPGSKHKSSVVAKFIKQAMNGEKLEIYGDGSQTRDFIYIKDLIQAILCATTADAGGEIFQIATNKETTVKEMVDILIPFLNTAGITDIKIINGEKRLGDVMRNFSDTSKAENLLKWKCLYNLQKGLSETVKWFMEIG